MIDKSGKKTAVLLEFERYEKLLEATDELDAIRAFDAAQKSHK